MSTYKYSLFDYHAIAEADITIDGITVLAGDNGCGKSTLSRWLYYLVNTSSRYEELLFGELKGQLDELLRQGRSVVREISRPGREFNASDFLEISSNIQKVSFSDENAVQMAMRFFRESIHLLGIGLIEYLSDTHSEYRVQRMNRYLNLNIESVNDFPTAIDRYVKGKLNEAELLLSEYNRDLEERTIERFFELLHSTYQVKDKDPERIQLSEDGVKLLRKNGLGNLLALERAIYVDTPMALSFGSTRSDSVFWQDLRQKIKSSPMPISSSRLKLLIRIKNLIGGEVRVQDSVYQGIELRFVRKGDNLNIKLEDTATGMKTFAYIQKLIENGFLNERTLLLIDEPEAHLHPRWIFEFAHLLVLLNKELGVKVMVASHNPDMVAAIQKVSQVEGLIDNTHFYQAYRQDESYQFVYRNLGGSINEIFRSFNIATSRIQDYGEQSE
jgi:predicted ATPase